ncbi:hypothetical protein HPB48_011127 [Haemaphysalis longicornis]|uniref:Monocarboxylate transporter n=1 Tax=Haemaphysalis longicornis TaxID=44386 RepID=A0A9J6GS89_HAELO|nr:hypothetical protein HPB48_011127 [Haemaphysalis longicornis]
MSLLVVNFGLKRTFILLGVVVMNVSPLALFLKAPEVLCCSCHKAAHLTPTSRLLKGQPYPKYVEENSKKDRTACIKNSSASQPQEERNDRNSHLYTKKVASISESVGKDLSVTKTTDENRAIKLTGASTISELPHLNVPYKRQGGVSHAVSVRQGLGKAMKTAVFYVIVAVYVIFDYTSVAVRATFVAFAMDKGSLRHEAESLIMYEAFGGLVGRLVLPWLSDTLRLRRGVATAACLAALSACLALLTGATSHVAVALVVVASSLPTGFIASMKPVMMADYIGLENLGATWSLAGAFTVPLLLANPAIIG